jgi:hypothetical protein
LNPLLDLRRYLIKVLRSKFLVSEIVWSILKD